MSKYSAASLCALLLAGPAAHGATMKAHYIDVGQGAANLLEFSCGTILIDFGGESNEDQDFISNQKLREYLEEFFHHRPDRPRRLDLVVISHPHIDHTRGTNELLTSENVDELPYEILGLIDDTLNKGSGKAQQKRFRAWAREHAKYEGIKVANIPTPDGLTSAVIDPLDCPDEDPVIRAVWGRKVPQPPAWSDEAYDDENNHSIVLRVDFGNASFLFTGDVEAEAERSMIDMYDGSDTLNVDVLQVGHHGSHTSTVEKYLEATSPEIIVIPVGDPTRPGPFTAQAHGHPRVDPVLRMKAHACGTRPAKTVPAAIGQNNFMDISMNKAVYATGWDGDIVIEADSDGSFEVESDNGATNGPCQ